MDFVSKCVLKFQAWVLLIKQKNLCNMVKLDPNLGLSTKSMDRGKDPKLGLMAEKSYCTKESAPWNLSQDDKFCKKMNLPDKFCMYIMTVRPLLLLKFLHHAKMVNGKALQ